MRGIVRVNDRQRRPVPLEYQGDTGSALERKERYNLKKLRKPQTPLLCNSGVAYGFDTLYMEGSGRLLREGRKDVKTSFEE